MLENFKYGQKVVNKTTGINCLIEKIDDAGFVVLDESFGTTNSKFTIMREEYFKRFGNDGRYSLSFKKFKEKINLL